MVANLKRGDKVRFSGGTYQNSTGLVLRLCGLQSVEVRLDTTGLPVTVRRRNVLQQTIPATENEESEKARQGAITNESVKKLSLQMEKLSVQIGNLQGTLDRMGHEDKK